MTTILSEVCTITMGQAPSGDSYNDRGDGLPLIAGAGDFKGQALAPSKFTTKPGKVSKPGDIVLSIRASIGAKVWADGEYCLGRGVAGLRPGPELDDKYLWHWLTHHERDLASKGRGATFLQVNKTDIGEMPIVVPPLSEQRRIAAILDHADTLRAKRRQVLTHLDSLTQSIFHEMFGNPDHWVDTIPFGQVASLVGGRNIVADDSSAESEYRVLKISAVTTGRFRPEESKPLPHRYIPPSRHLVRPGDLLMSRANTSELVGAVAYVDSAPSRLALPDKIWRFEWKLDAAPLFWHALLSTHAMRRRVSTLSTGTGGSMKNVSKAKLEVMPVPRVEVSRQQEFANQALAVAQHRAKIDHVRLREDELFASLQFRAFRGEL